MSLRQIVVWWGLFPWLAAGAFGAQPTISGFDPTVGGPGDRIRLSGSGFFTPGIAVYFWLGVPGSIYFISGDSQMDVTVPAGCTTGPIGVQAPGWPVAYTASNFTAIGTGPYISSFSPTFGAVNDLVIVYGAHLTNASAVRFNGVASTSFVPNAAGTQISAYVPSGATNGPISVTTPYGTSNSPSAFTVIGAGPYITGFSPGSGAAGQAVMVEGVHFTSATSATFNGVAGTGFAVLSDTRIQVNAPAGVTTGPVAVNSPLGNSVTSSNFFVPPTVTGLFPGTGRSGTNVGIAGTNFLGTTAVTFGGLAANYTVLSNRAIVATVPAGARTALVRVITPAYSAFSPTNFVVQPTVTNFTPVFGGVGSSVIIQGANFDVGTPVVRFNGVTAAAPTGVTFGQLTAVVPAGATTGPISVTTTDGSHTNANNFYLPPAISSFSPNNSAPGSRVSVVGQNLRGATAVTFNGYAAAGFTVTNNTSLGATVPAGVSTGPIRVITPGGTATSSGWFYGAPLITDFAPRHGLPGNSVTLLGTNFLGATAVRFNGVPAAINSANNSQLVTVVPGGAQTGPITVEAPGGTNQSAINFVLDYTSDLQVWMTNYPNPVTVGSNLLYTITIRNNGPFDALNPRFTNTLPASVTLLSTVVTAPWTLTTNGDRLIGRTTNLIASGMATLLLNVAPQVQGNILDAITVASDYTDPVQANNTASINTTVEPLALLAIQKLTNQVKVSWSSFLSNYNLEYRNSLAAGGFWSNVPTAPIISGPQQFVTETNTGLSRFFRLRR